MDALPARLDIGALHARLCQRLAALRPLVVADVMRAFLEVASLACDEGLWSLEFAFDEDDGRVARLEAHFIDPSGGDARGEDVLGYEVRVVLPRLIPPRAAADAERAAAHGIVVTDADRSLVARFVRALADLGAYRAIERLEALSAEAHLL